MNDWISQRNYPLRRFGACAGPRAFPKGTLHLNGNQSRPHLLRNLDANSGISLHLIPEPEEKASELLRDLTANHSGTGASFPEVLQVCSRGEILGR